jgi:hypothetical protein
VNFNRIASRALVWFLAAFLLLVNLRRLLDYPPPDFLAFYLGGKMAAGGHIAQVYDKAAYRPYIAELRDSGVRMNDKHDAHYFIRPAFQAFLYAPFALLPYRAASRLAILCNLVLLGLLAWKLPVWFGVRTYRTALRVALVVFYPFMWSLSVGQDTLLLTLILAWSLRLEATGREGAAGLVLGLACFKPHLVVLVPAALWISGRRRMTVGFASTAGLLGAAWVAMVGIDGIRAWAGIIREPSSDIAPHVMGNLRAMAIYLGTPAAVAAAVVAAAALAAILWAGSFTDRFCAVLAAALLASPHTYWQDYSVMSLVALLSPMPVRLAVFVPWPYLYSRLDMLPAIFGVLLWLGWTAGRSVRGRLRREAAVPAGAVEAG